MKKLTTILIAALILVISAPALAGTRVGHVSRGTHAVSGGSWQGKGRAKVKRQTVRTRRLHKRARTIKRKQLTRSTHTTLRGLAGGLLVTTPKRTKRSMVVRTTPRTLRALGSLLDNRGRQQRLDDLALMSGSSLK